MVKVFEGVDTITFVLGEHRLVVDINNDQLFFDGERLKTTRPEFNYNRGLMFEKNKVKQKKRLLTCTACGEVLAVDTGFDGRIFIKQFSREGYHVFRHAPIKTFSYWHCRREGLKKWYDGDLSNPKKIWKAQYSKQVI